MTCCKKRTLWRFIALFSMILSLALLGASVCGLLTYYCMMNPAVSSFQMDNTYFTYALYFYNNRCEDAHSDYKVLNLDPSDRTWGWVIVYIVVKSLWFFTSLLLFHSPNFWKSPTGLWMTYPWLLVTFSVLCVDVASSVLYGLDYGEIDTLDKLFEFTGIVYMKRPSEFNYFPVPTILMVGIFSKAFLGWIFVLFNFVLIYVSMVGLGKPESLYLQTRAPIDFYTPSSAVNPAFEGEMNEVFDATAPPASTSISPDPYSYGWDDETPNIVIPRVSQRFYENSSAEERVHQGQLSRADYRNSEVYTRAHPWAYLPENFPHPVLENENFGRFRSAEPRVGFSHQEIFKFDSSYI